MKMNRRIFALLVATAAFLVPACGFAADYPGKPVKIIVPFAAGAPPT